MIPLHLSLSGFLSYRDPVEIDFSAIDLACISGSNGAGKSSLLDAVTWALFGQARKHDDSLINAQSSTAQVCLDFAYEGNVYRVQRTKPRDKTTMLEFQILQDTGMQNLGSASTTIIDRLATQAWKPITEHTLRETENRIQQTLRMDYETFTNASFFLQGKADQFTQQRPGDRKRILGSILGLEVWETYRQRANDRRKLVEDEITNLDGRLHEIAAELDEEAARKSRLKSLEADLKRLAKETQNQAATLQSIRQIAATLAEQSKLVDTLARQCDTASSRLQFLENRLQERSQEKNSYAAMLSKAEQIEAAYAAWQAARLELGRWEGIAIQFREHEKRRESPRSEIQTARARLEQEQQTLISQQAEAAALSEEITALQPQTVALGAGLAACEAQLRRREQLEASLQDARQRLAEARAENPRLKSEMEELKERIQQLSSAEGAECPLCGQPLNAEERQTLIEKLNLQGTEMGDRYRANQNLLRQSNEIVSDLESQIAALAQVEAEARVNSQQLAQVNSRLEALDAQILAWEARGAPRLQELELRLKNEAFAQEARLRLAEIDAGLKEIGYDAAAHDAVRRAEMDGRSSEGEVRFLESARAALAPLEREIADLQAQMTLQLAETARQQQEYQAAAAALAAAQAQAPDLYQAERAYFDLQEQENRLRLEVGAARQKVLVLDDLKVRRKDLETQRETWGRQVRQYRQLERAFSKDGVPALLIEQALPEIENKANDILTRLSDGSMTVRFATQTAYKDKHRDDLRETLDIQISDGAGMRDYEMYSGGEAFRVNFAIRLALSEVLAQRAGARLQTLVIDEGFGSQDAQGRQRLIESINLVRPDFAKILVITHIDELKDAFATRIEVEKTDRGSVVRVV